MQPWCTLWFFGDGVEARHYYELAANQGKARPLRKTILVMSTARKDLVWSKITTSKARYFYELAAEQGNAHAQSNLGDLYFWPRSRLSQSSSILVKCPETEKAQSKN
jgi:TPR repeat protein